MQLPIKKCKRMPNFNNEEMIELARKTDDKELKDKVIENNVPLVLKLVNRWKDRGSTESTEDLISMGLCGLVVAFNTYDTSRNIKFSSYAGKVIWMEFMKNARYNEMQCRSKYIKVNLEDPVYTCKSKFICNDDTIADVVFDSEEDNFKEIEDRLFAERLNLMFNSFSFTPKEKMVGRKYFLEGKSLAEIGKEMGVTRQAVHQTHKRNVTRLNELIFQ